MRRQQGSETRDVEIVIPVNPHQCVSLPFSIYPHVFKVFESLFLLLALTFLIGIPLNSHQDLSN